MKDTFQIISSQVDKETKLLQMQAAGTIGRRPANHRLRVIAVFSAVGAVRRFPMEAVSQKEEAFEIQAQISLPDIFYPAPEGIGGQQVQIAFEYCAADGVWVAFPEKLFLDGGYFVQDIGRGSAGRRLLCALGYAGCTLLLPVWLLDGYLAVKGVKQSPYIDSEIKGRKGMFYHAQGIVKHLTGYGYSMREIKTGYFARQYKKACRRISRPEGILFLSEREVDRGGNLDLIRRGVQEQQLPWGECIDSRPIHQLPFAQIRRTARQAAGARVIVLEDFYPQLHAVTLRSETKLLQLWHACGAFKMFGLSDIGKVSHLGQDTKNHRNYSATFVSGTQMVPFYSEAFGIAPEQVLPIGVPRTDVLFDKAYRQRAEERLYADYPQLSGKKAVLFAPTFRGSGKKRAYYPMGQFPADRLLEELPEDTILLIKNHPFVKEHFSFADKYSERVLDLSGRENINDLLFVTDLLITDYSSCIFEAALLEIPTLFYVFDLEEYVGGRDIYFDFASFAPGSQAADFEELVAEAKRLLEGGDGEDSEKRRAFCEYFLNSLDGHSTARILEYVRGLMEKKDGKWAV